MAKKVNSKTKKLQRRKRTLQIGNYFLFGSSFLTLTIIPWLAEMLNVTIEDGIRLSVALLAAITGLVIQQYLNKEDIAGAIENIKNDTKIEYAGPSTEVLPRIARKMKHAVDVKNTFVGIDEYDYDERNGAEISQIYTSWLENGKEGTWTDIVGPAQLFSGRYEQISVRKKKIHGTHEIKILRHSTPIVNFTIIEYEEDDTEVFFGWMAGSRNSNIFLSSDRHAVKIFSKYFEKLENHRLWGPPIEVNYSAQKHKRLRRNDLVDKIGNWMTISIREGTIVTYGFFTIEITKKPTSMGRSGIVFIDGLLLDRSLNFIEDINHGQEHISHYTNKMFIEYGNSNTGRKGFCFYEFEQGINNPAPEPDPESGYVGGFFIDQGSSIRNDILGFKTTLFSPTSDPFPKFEAAIYTLETLRKQSRITEAQYLDAYSKIEAARETEPT